MQQADILAFDQVRQHDDQESAAKLSGFGGPAPSVKKPRKPRRR